MRDGGEPTAQADTTPAVVARGELDRDVAALAADSTSPRSGRWAVIGEPDARVEPDVLPAVQPDATVAVLSDALAADVQDATAAVAVRGDGTALAASPDVVVADMVADVSSAVATATRATRAPQPTETRKPKPTEQPGTYDYYIKTAERASSRSQALDNYFEAHKLRPLAPDPLLKIAQIYMSGGDHANALIYYKKLLERMPAHGSALVNAGGCSLAVGNREAAIRFYRRYLESYPATRDAEAVRDKLRSLGVTP